MVVWLSASPIGRAVLSRNIIIFVFCNHFSWQLSIAQDLVQMEGLSKLTKFHYHIESWICHLSPFSIARPIGNMTGKCDLGSLGVDEG